MKKVIVAPLSFVWNILRKHWLACAGLLCLEMLAVAMSIAVPYMAKLQIDQLEAAHQSLFGFITGSPLMIFVWILVMGMLIQLLQSIFNDITFFIRQKIDLAFSVETEVALYEKLEEYDMGFLQNPRNQRILDIIGDARNIVWDIIRFVTDNMQSVLYVAGVLPLIAFVDTTIFFIILGTTIVQFVLRRIFDKRRQSIRLQGESRTVRSWRVTRVLRYELHQLLLNSGLKKFLAQLRELRENEFLIDRREDIWRNVERYINLIIDNLQIIVIGTLTAIQVYQGNVSIGTFTMILGYAGSLNSSITSLFQVYGNSIDMYLLLARVGFFFNLKSKLSLEKVQPLETIPQGDLVCKAMEFRYPHYGEDEKEYMEFLVARMKRFMSKNVGHYYKTELEEWERLLESLDKPNALVLEGVDATFAVNKITAVVGRNGSGKTTLMSLLMRHFDPEKGSLHWGDRLLESVNPSTMRSLVSVIQQQPYVMTDFTIRENMTLGTEREVSDEELWEILERVELAEQVREMPGKLEARVGEDAGLSGGQQQLLVIGRVLLQKRPIIIFDEGTNQLDAEKELQIMRVLRSLREGRIVIMVTHRMTSARKADCIIGMQKGRVVEQGTHEELIMHEKGLYKRFWDLQVEGKMESE